MGRSLHGPSMGFNAYGNRDLNTLPGLLSGLIPTEPIPGGYFMYFCLGYFIHKMPSLYSTEFLKRIAVLGIAGWLLGAVAAIVGYVRSDPSYLWLFASVGIFLIFDKIQILVSAHRESSIGRQNVRTQFICFNIRQSQLCSASLTSLECWTERQIWLFGSEFRCR